MKVDAMPLSDRLQLLDGIKKITSPQSDTQINGALQTPDAPKGAKSFGDFFMDQLKSANDTALDGERHLENYVQGKEENPHDTYIALQNADISFQLLMQVKQQVQAAYQTIVRTPIG